MADQPTGRDVVVIGGSAGAVDPLTRIVASFPDGFPAAVFVVLHLSPNSPGLLPEILNRSSRLEVKHARHGEPIRRGRIYIAPPDRHLLLHRSLVRLSRGPRENRFRPAIDPLFRTAARTFGPRVVGLLLSGGLNDGIYGLMFIKEHGGIALVQDPEEAEYPTLVRSAVDHVAVDQILTSDQVAAAVSRLVHEAVQNMTPEDKPADNAESFSLGLPRRPEGKLAPLVCPECGGSLWESQHGSLIRYECHEGHAFTLESLLAKQSDAIEAALWSALRVLDENVELFRRMADNAQQMGRLESSRTFQEDVRDAEERANLIRGVLLGPGSA